MEALPRGGGKGPTASGMDQRLCAKSLILNVFSWRPKTASQRLGARRIGRQRELAHVSHNVIHSFDGPGPKARQISHLGWIVDGTPEKPCRDDDHPPP